MRERQSLHTKRRGFSLNSHRGMVFLHARHVRFPLMSCIARIICSGGRCAYKYATGVPGPQPPMRTVPGDGAQSFLFSAFGTAYPDWGAFRGAWYDGRATHDPREQALVADMLTKSTTLPPLPAWVRLHIARLACCAPRRGLSSPRVPALRLVCKPSDAGRRLLATYLLSKQLRRLFDSIPLGASLWTLYHTWTAEVAAAVRATDGRNRRACLDACSPVLSRYNRLLLRGLHRLDPRGVSKYYRPAYVPSAGLVRDWASEVSAESGWDAMSRVAARVHANFQWSKGMIAAHILAGTGGGGCTSSLILENTRQCTEMYSKLNTALVQEQLLQEAATLYNSLYSLGLNSAERDYFFMVSASEHSDRPLGF